MSESKQTTFLSLPFCNTVFHMQIIVVATYSLDFFCCTQNMACHAYSSIPNIQLCMTLDQH